MYETLEDLEDLVKREIKMINEKGDLTPSELCNVKEAVELLNEIKKFKGGDSFEDEYSEAMRSGRGYSHMGDYDMEGSYRRGRDSMGRFTSRDGRSREGRSYEGSSREGRSYEGSSREGRSSEGSSRDGRSYDSSYRSMGRMSSGHSIKDRMKATLEDMVDKAKSDYEREEILETIDRLDLMSR